MPDWLINIVSVTPTTAAFNPETQDCLAGDNITWTNKTDTSHQPVPLNPKPPAWSASFGVNAVPAGQSSNPTYSVVAPVQLDPNTGQPVKDANGKTIPVYGPVTYQCKNHPNEVGKFNILKVPPTF
jgi:plastocyanin